MLIIRELNRGVYADKNAKMTVGNFGAYLVLETWDPLVREQNARMIGGNGAFNLE
jgi:hypothetical protein